MKRKTLTESTAPPQVLVLEEALDLSAASELAKSLNAMRGKAVTIDPAHVGRVGAQCIQVLVSASKSWSEDGVEFLVEPGSEPFNEGLRLLGLTSFFSDERAS